LSVVQREAVAESGIHFKYIRSAGYDRRHLDSYLYV
jgi:hypothetical protein